MGGGALSGPIADWAGLRALALGMGLPGVVETTSWDHPVLKAHGKLWVWWSPKEDAAVFKCGGDERDMLIAADPDAFFVTSHYAGHGLMLVRPGHIDPGWARARLLSVWRAQAPKRVLTAWDAGA